VLLLLAQVGLSPGDLVTAPRDRPPVPAFAEYVPVASGGTPVPKPAHSAVYERLGLLSGFCSQERRVSILVAGLQSSHLVC
jgi:hypothetical protein